MQLVFSSHGNTRQMHQYWEGLTREAECGPWEAAKCKSTRVEASDHLSLGCLTSEPRLGWSLSSEYLHEEEELHRGCWAGPLTFLACLPSLLD